MSRYLLAFNCEDCGRPSRRRRDTGQARVCEDCGLSRSVSNAREIANGTGPGYEKWRKGMEKFAARIAVGQ